MSGSADGPVPAIVDAKENSRALTNLVADAIRHTPPDGSVVVEARTEPGAAVISVADECGGIDPEHLSRLFEPGWRGTDARTPMHGEGAGLGLAIVQGITLAHGGSVDVRNEGPGCRFDIRIPAAA